MFARAPVERDPVKPGQESVWDFPRPARCEKTDRHVVVIFNGVRVADSNRVWRAVETSHPPTYYVPEADILEGALEAVAGTSFCEWKGQASYFDVVAGGKRAPRAAWTYRSPTVPFMPIAEMVAFYAAAMDACYVDDEQARPQPGGFYGGWVTDDLAGPFKGAPGSEGW